MPSKSERTVADLVREAGKKAKSNFAAVTSPRVTADIPQGMVVLPPLEHAPKIYNIIDYIEQPWGLGLKLYPVQKVIVKLFYHIPLDDRVKCVPVLDMFHTRVLQRLTEREYLRYLYDTGRCNIREQDHERHQLVLVLGRRSGKTLMSSIFASYEIYRLLNLHDPQAFYGLPPGNRIQIISVGTDKDVAALSFGEVTNHLQRCEYFKPYIANNTQTYIQFRTPADIDKYGATTRHDNGKFVSFGGKATLRVMFKSAVARGLRGHGNILIIIDEMAHFKNSGDSSAANIYGSLAPSKSAFSPKDPNTGEPIRPVDARIICISSPMNKSGKFYDLYDQAMRGGEGTKELLAIRAPSWEVNPTIETDELKQAYYGDTNSFMVEYGAEFSDRVSRWIEDPTYLTQCVDPALRPREMGVPRAPYQMGIDLALKNDGTAIAITHCEEDKIVLDYHELWMAGRSWKETNPHLRVPQIPYANELERVDVLDFAAIADWILALTRKFSITDGIFDRWVGIVLEQELKKRGLNQFTCEYFKPELKSQMYQSLKLLMHARGLRLYDWPIPQAQDAKNSLLVSELLDLQADYAGKDKVLVSAPRGLNKHDDMSDAYVRACWLTSQRMVNGHHSFSSLSKGEIRGTPPTVFQYQYARARARGFVPERMNPRMAARFRGNQLTRFR